MLVAALWACLILCLPATAQTIPDPISTRVNDFAGLLPDPDERALSQRLAALERETAVQMTVVTLDRQADFAPDIPLEAFATALFDQWGIGDRQANTGVLVLVLPGDRAMRIELGRAYGRDWDRVSQGLVDRIFVPAFADGRYRDGIMQGADAVIAQLVRPAVAGAPPPRPPAAQDQRAETLKRFLGLSGLFALILAVGMRQQLWDALGRLTRCPRCGRRGRRTIRATISPPFAGVPGRGARTRICPHCDHSDRKEYSIPPPSTTNGHRSGAFGGHTGGTFGGGSFGGGSSGGGGASGRW